MESSHACPAAARRKNVAAQPHFSGSKHHCSDASGQAACFRTCFPLRCTVGKPEFSVTKVTRVVEVDRASREKEGMPGRIIRPGIPRAQGKNSCVVRGQETRAQRELTSLN